MKKWVIMLLVLIPLVLAQDPTAQDLLNSNQAVTYDAFDDLSDAEQSKFLLQAPLNNPNNLAVIREHFQDDSDNINNNRKAFIRYLRQGNIDLVGFTGEEGVEGLSEDGVLEGQDQSVNLNEFGNPNIRKNYALKIVDGKISVVSKKAGLSIPFTGDLRANKEGFSIKEGSISGHEISGASNLRFIGSKKNLIAEGKFKSIGGITFAAPTLVKGIPKPPTIILNGAEITEVDNPTVAVRGNAAVKNFGDLDDSLKVLKGTSFRMNGWEVRAKKETELRFGTKWTSEEGNYVRFADKVTASGEGFRVRFNPLALIKQETAFEGDYDGFLHIPEDGYNVGDDGESVKVIQRTMGLKDTGEYSTSLSDSVKNMKNYIFKTQGKCFGTQSGSKCSVDGSFNQELRDYYIGGKRNIDIEMKGGQVELSNTNSHMAVDITGSVCMTIRKKTCTSKNGIASSIGNPIVQNFRVPVKTTLRDKEGEVLSTAEKSYQRYNRPSVRVVIQGKSYEMRVGEAYVITTKQTAFTKAVAPKASVEDLKKFGGKAATTIAGAGHMGVVYVDEDGKLRATESAWEGVTDKPWGQSHLKSQRIVGIFGMPSADGSKIIARSKLDGKRRIGWFFTGAAPTALVNWKTGQDYEDYRTCSGHVCTLVESGGVDLESSAVFLPMRGGDVSKLNGYVKSFGKGIKDPSFKKLVKSGEAGKMFASAIESVDTLNRFTDTVGIGPVIETPSQLIFGGLKNGLLDPLQSTSSSAYKKN